MWSASRCGVCRQYILLFTHSSHPASFYTHTITGPYYIIILSAAASLAPYLPLSRRVAAPPFNLKFIPCHRGQDVLKSEASAAVSLTFYFIFFPFDLLFGFVSSPPTFNFIHTNVLDRRLDPARVANPAHRLIVVEWDYWKPPRCYFGRSHKFPTYRG